MICHDNGLLFWLLLCGLVVGCHVVIAGDAAAVEKPTDPGPYSAGYFDVTLNATHDRQTIWLDCRYYYPATSDGEGADPDPTGASYPPIIYHIYFHDYPNVKLFNRTNDRERIEFVVSHGFIVVTFTPIIAGISAERSFYNDLVYHTDSYDENVSSPLHGMVKKDAYGALGEYLGGSLSFCHAAFTDRIIAVHSLQPFFGNNLSGMNIGFTTAWNKKEMAWMIQKGGKGAAYEGYLFTQYEAVGPEKMMVTIPGVGERGPFRLDLVVAFFHQYLGGKDEYGTFVHGEEARNETYTGQSWFRYEMGDGDDFLFRPVFTMDIPSMVMMDEEVTLSVTCDSYVLWDHPTIVHEWYLGEDAEPDITSTTNPNVTHIFTDPGTIFNVRYMYNIGNVSIQSNTGTIRVINVWPTANAGENATVYQDEHFELNGSNSTDSLSDIDTLEYNWSALGKVSGWSTDPMFEVDTSKPITFTASLLVRDRHGRVSSASDKVTVSIINRQPEATLGPDKTSKEDEVVELLGQGNDSYSDVPLLEFRWVFGDGTTSQWSSSNRTNHSYSRQGTYTITLQVKDPKGATDSATLSITVENVAPEAGIDLPLVGTEADMGTKVRFVGGGRDTLFDNGSLWYFWDFGDGVTAEGREISHTYKEAGRYTITLTVEDNDGATAVVMRSIEIAEAPGLEGPLVASAAVSVVAILGLVFVATTEPGKYWFGLLLSPLFARTKDVLDNKTRHALLGIIVANPGIHYNAIKEEFGLANGAAAYHLDVLERESFIRSVRDGKLKRFYSIHAKVPEDVGMSPEETREEIVMLVRRSPGINQMGVMEELGLNRDAASYYLRELVKEGQLKAGREGRFMVYRAK